MNFTVEPEDVTEFFMAFFAAGEDPDAYGGRPTRWYPQRVSHAGTGRIRL